MISPESFLDEKKVCNFHEPTNNYPDKIISVGDSRKTRDEIHGNIFPFSRGKRQRLQGTRMPKMASFHLPTNVTSSNIISNFTSHIVPSELIKLWNGMNYEWRWNLDPSHAHHEGSAHHNIQAKRQRIPIRKNTPCDLKVLILGGVICNSTVNMALSTECT